MFHLAPHEKGRFLQEARLSGLIPPRPENPLKIPPVEEGQRGVSLGEVHQGAGN